MHEQAQAQAKTFRYNPRSPKVDTYKSFDDALFAAAALLIEKAPGPEAEVVRQAFAWREMQAQKVADEEAERVERTEAAQRETAEREQHETEMAAARLQASVTREAVAQQLLSQLLDDVL